MRAPNDGKAPLGYDNLVLKSMKERWHAHETEMDQKGREFVEGMERAHTHVLQRISRVQNFDLKEVLSIVQEHAVSLREMTMGNFQDTRVMEGEFSKDIYCTTKVGQRRKLEPRLESAPPRFLNL